jgi:hypothetical protein
MIEGIKPCNPILKEALERLDLEFEGDELGEDGLHFVYEQDEENYNAFSIAALDEDGYANSALIGWSEEKGELFIVCHNPMTESHDVAEGIDANESKCWWTCPSLDMLILHLDGTVRQVIYEEVHGSGLPKE